MLTVGASKVLHKGEKQSVMGPVPVQVPVRKKMSEPCALRRRLECSWSSQVKLVRKTRNCGT